MGRDSREVAMAKAKWLDEVDMRWQKVENLCRLLTLPSCLAEKKGKGP